jgi:hypothetical protein
MSMKNAILIKNYLKKQLIAGSFWFITNYQLPTINSIHPIGSSPSGYGTTAAGTTSEAGMAWRG